MGQFHWQQDEGDSWQEPASPDKAPEPRRWYLIPLILSTIGAAVFIGYLQAQQRLAEVTVTLTNDVLSGHTLLSQAAYRNDLDIFTILLSGRDAQWTASQKTLLRDNLFFDRPSFGLYATFPSQPDLILTQDNLVSIDFSPDLLSAELVVRQPYTVTLPTGQIQHTTLLQTAVYRQGDERWLFAPPDDDFWGATRRYSQNQLRVTYPLRDEELVQRLALDLDQTISQLCRTLADINCPDDMAVTVEFSPEPASLINLTETETFWQNSQPILLPTPTLVGLPTDDAGYEVLFRGYAAQMAAAVIPDLVAWECCQHLPFFQVLLDYQLSQLGLRTWPVTQSDYQRARDEKILFAAAGYWQTNTVHGVDPEDWWFIYLVADFLLQSEISSAAAAQRTLESRGLLSWLANNALAQPELAFSSNGILQKWVRTILIDSQTTPEPPPQPVPNQELLLHCANNSLDTTAGGTLYRYNLATAEWRQEDETNELLLMNPLPDDTGVVLQGFDGDLTGPLIWQDAQPIHPIIDKEGTFISLGHIYPSGHMLAYQLADPGEPITPELIDLTDCLNSAQCATEARPGLLAWAPDGRQTITTEPTSFVLTTFPVNNSHYLVSERSDDQAPFTLFRTDNNKQIPIGAGFEPFWVDDKTYGYLRPTGSDLEIVLANTTTDNPQRILSSSTLFNILSTNDNIIPPFTINTILTHPNHPHKLFIVANSGSANLAKQAHIFTFDLMNSHFRHLLQMNYLAYLGVTFSPDGRWLIVNDWQETIEGTVVNFNSLLLFDLRDSQSKTYVTIFPPIFPTSLHDWSADGHWLAMIADDDKIALALPDSDFYQIIQHPFGPCTSVAWINKSG